MRSGGSQMVGVILHALDVPCFGIMAHVIAQELFRRGLQALICCTNESADQGARYVAMLLSQQVDGVLVASVQEDSTPYQRLVDARIPIVAVDRALPGLTVLSVAADHWAGGRMMAEHLLGLGHRHFAVIGAPQHSPPVLGAGAGRGCRARVQGATERVAEAGLTAQLVLGSANDFDACRALAVGILRNGRVAKRPTAVIGTTDIAAIGVVHAAIGMGLSVPNDVSVIVALMTCQKRAMCRHP